MQTKIDPFVYEGKKDLDRIICDTIQDLTITLRVIVHGQAFSFPLTRPSVHKIV